MPWRHISWQHSPLVPHGDEAREWAERELADPLYRAAEPTPFDRLARGIGDFLVSLFSGDVPAAFTPWLAVLVVVVIVAVVALSLAVWGRPRPVARPRTSPVLFGADDRRTADQLREDARTASEAAQWADAIVLAFRALATGLAERTVVDPEPGATVHRFAREAARAFPSESANLDLCADLFDDVRYLRRRGTEEAYRAVSELDSRLRAASPTWDAESAGTAKVPT